MPPQPAATRSRPAASRPALCDRPSVALVIPTLREAASLPALLARVTAALDASCPNHEILVVDDDSRDGTAEIVTTAAQQDPRVRLLVRRGERGLSGAILHGWQQTDAPILGVMDADLQHPPELLPALIAAIQNGADAAIASRYRPSPHAGITTNNGCPTLATSLFLSLGWETSNLTRLFSGSSTTPGCRANNGGWNPLRKFLSATAIALTRPLQRPSIRVADPISGFFLVRRRCVRNVLFQPAGFKLLLEILVRGSIAKVSEVPFAFGRRTAGRSKANLQVASEYIRLLARLYALRSHRAAIITEESSGD